MFSVVFIEPEKSGNVGALARVMKNFGLKELILVNPQCEMDSDALARAKHAKDVVEHARIIKKFDGIGEFDFIIGTTGKIVQGYDEVRCAITPRELAGQIKSKDRIALVFGREGTGLTNRELAACDIIVHIPADKHYPVLNISHAAAILFYELFSADCALSRKADGKENGALFRYFEEILNGLDGIRDKEKVSKIFRNVVNRSLITGKEAHAIAGALKEIRKKLSG